MSQFDDFVKANPDLTEEELELEWKKRPLAKRIASGIEAGVEGVGTAVKSPYTLASAVNKKYEENLGPDTPMGKKLRPQYEIKDWASKKPATNLTAKDEKELDAHRSSYGIAPIPADRQQMQSKEEAFKGFPEAPLVAEDVGTAPATLPKGAAVASGSGKQEKPKGGPSSRVDEISEYSSAIKDPDIQGRLAEIKDLMQKAQDQYAEDKDRTRWAEVMETLGNAVAQIGAGAYGMKHGVDATSGLKFSKTDWDKRMENAMQELRAKQQPLVSETGELIGLQKERERTAVEMKRASDLEKFRMLEAEKDRQNARDIAGLRASGAESSASKQDRRALELEAKQIQDELRQMKQIAASKDKAGIKKAIISSGGTPDDSWFSNKNVETYQGLLAQKEQKLADINAQLRAGQTPSPQQQQVPTPFPITLRKGNKTATVKNATELAEAKQEGWVE